MSTSFTLACGTGVPNCTRLNGRAPCFGVCHRAEASTTRECQSGEQGTTCNNGSVLTKNQIPTPALLVDLDALEANSKRMAERVQQSGKKLRPHAKAHKCVELAKRQIAAGAYGISVATLAEPDLMSNPRIPGLLITS